MASFSSELFATNTDNLKRKVNIFPVINNSDRIHASPLPIKEQIPVMY